MFIQNYTTLYSSQRAIYANLGPVHTNAFSTVCKRIHFDAFGPYVHTNTLSAFIDLKTLLKVNQNKNAYISY